MVSIGDMYSAIPNTRLDGWLSENSCVRRQIIVTPQCHINLYRTAPNSSSQTLVRTMAGDTLAAALPVLYKFINWGKSNSCMVLEAKQFAYMITSFKCKISFFESQRKYHFPCLFIFLIIGNMPAIFHILFRYLFQGQSDANISRVLFESTAVSVHKI